MWHLVKFTIEHLVLRKCRTDIKYTKTDNLMATDNSGTYVYGENLLPEIELGDDDILTLSTDPTQSRVMSAEDPNPAATPTACEDIQGDGRWMSLHSRFVSDSKDKEPDVLFVGDSLVQLMHQFGVWRQLFSPLHALNFGVGGDATQHVLWRLSNGELDNISPKVVVLWVGTNNHGHTAEQICGGIMAIVQVIKNKLPHARTLVLGLLPRGKMPNPLRERNAKVNKLALDAIASLPHASFLNVDPGFVHSNGSISHQDMYDYLHLTPQGFQAVCEPLHAHLKSMLDKPPEN